jgi:hypothetical protein
LQRAIEQAQGSFAMIAAVLTELIEDARLVQTPGSVITTVDFGEILALGGQTHVRVLGNHEYESTYCRTPPVQLHVPATFILSQLGSKAFVV